MSKDDAKGRRGPKPERVKIDEDWEEAVKKALRKKRPKDGWPDHEDEKSHRERQPGQVEGD